MSTREDLLKVRLAQLDEISQRRNGILRQMYELIKGDHAVGSLTSDDSPEDTELTDFLDRLDLNQGVQSGSIITLPDSWFELPPSLRTEEIVEERGSPEQSEDYSPARLQLSKSPPALSDRRSRSITPSTPFHEEVSNENDRRSPSLLESISASPGGSPHPLEESPEDADLTDLPSLSRSPSPVDEVIGEHDSMQNESNEIVDDGLPLTQEEHPDELDEDMVIVNDESADMIDIDETEPGPEFIPESEDTRLLSEDRDQELQMANLTSDEIIPPTPTPDIEDSENIAKLMPSIEPEVFVPPPDMKSDLEDLEDISSPFSDDLESNPPHTPPPTVVVLLPTPYSTVFRPTIRAPSPIHEPDFNFDGDLWAEAFSEPNKSSSDNRVFFNPHYSIPPLHSLPPEFQRKKTARQQRKREKDKDRSDYKRDDWAPLGMNKWRALLRANPTWKHVSKSSKSLTTKDWNVALTELRLIRTFERIEMLKDNGRWSFRQPKKQRGVGGLVKTHWDYLMDEMRWMRVDFREERKWKIALAYKLAVSVQEWHAAGSVEERVRRGICVVWPRSHPDENSPSASIAPVVEEEDIPAGSVDEDPNTNPQASMQIGDYGSDDGSDDDPDKELGDADALDANGTAQDTLQNGIQPKVEDVEEYLLMSLQMSHPDVQEQQMDVDTGPSTSRDSQEETDPTQGALKPASQNPLLQAAASRTAIAVMTAALREQVAYADTTKLFIDMDDLELEKPFHDNVSSEGVADILPQIPDLSVLFPDLQPYGLLEVVPAEISLDVKKNNRRERDDPNKRSEDTTYSKLTPVSKFMYCRPTLVGPLQPSRHWSNGEWSGLDDYPVYPSDLPRSQEGSICALFDRSMLNPSIVKPPGPLDPKRIPESHIAEQLWSSADDHLLRSLVDIYHNNWSLIADAFNTSRISVSTDRRTAWDCYYRYTLLNAKQDAETPTPVTNLSNRPKRQVAMNASEAALANAQLNLESKKRKRRMVMQEAVRKVAKKRDAVAKAAINQKRQTVIHDTHGQYNKMPKLTPQELGRMKAEKDYHEHLARQRTEELRVKTAREQQVRIQQGTQNSPNGVARVASNGFPAPAQPLPAMRTPQVNISQQQRLSNPMTAAANARLSPQHQQAVQAQVRAMAAAQQAQVHGQVQIQGQPQQQNGQPMAGAHISPTLSSANQSSSSPSTLQTSPPSLVPSSAGTPVSYGNGSSSTPRPPSTQPQLAHAQIPNNIPRAAVPGMPSVPQYYASVNMGGQQFASSEHVEQALRFIQAHQRQQIPGSQQTSPPPAQLSQTQGLYPAQ